MGIDLKQRGIQILGLRGWHVGIIGLLQGSAPSFPNYLQIKEAERHITRYMDGVTQVAGLHTG